MRHKLRDGCLDRIWVKKTSATKYIVLVTRLCCCSSLAYQRMGGAVALTTVASRTGTVSVLGEIQASEFTTDWEHAPHHSARGEFLVPTFTRVFLVAATVRRRDGLSGHSVSQQA